MTDTQLLVKQMILLYIHQKNQIIQMKPRLTFSATPSAKENQRIRMTLKQHKQPLQPSTHYLATPLILQV